MKEWLGFGGVVLAAFIAAWGASGPTLSRRVKHHADLLSSLPEDMKEPLRSILREELREYGDRERGRLYPSWRRLRLGRFLFDLVGLGAAVGGVRSVALADPGAGPVLLMLGLSSVIIGIVIFDFRYNLFKPLPPGSAPGTPQGR